MGNLSDALLTTKRQTIPGCRIARILVEIKDDSSIDKHDLAALVQCVEDPGFSQNGIARILKERGYFVDAAVIVKHRHHGDCTTRIYPSW